MNWNNLDVFLGIIGAILGIAGVWYAFKFRTISKLSFYEHECLLLFKTIVKNFTDIEIKYKNDLINQNLIFYKSTILNSGNIDLDKNNTYKPLIIQLPESFVWKEFKINKLSKDLDISFSNISEQKIQIVWDIFKSSEFFTFDSLIEFTGDKKELENGIELTKKIKFEQRITNLKTVETDELILNRTQSKYRRLIRVFLPSVMIILSLMMPIITFVSDTEKVAFKVKSNQDTIYKTYDISIKGEFVELSEHENIILKIFNSENKKKITLSEFNNKYLVKIFPDKPDDISYILFIAVIYFFTGVYFFISFNYKDVKNNKLRKLINNA